ncbi:AsmA family protein, partial [Achromobacter xylosoxidans]
MTRKTKIAGGIVGGIVLLVAVLVVVVATFDWNRARPMINERVSAAIGRPFAINGDLSVEWSRESDEGGWRAWVPWPRVVANDISVANTEWGKAPQFATLKRGEFSLSPLPLLSQRVVIRRIQLTEPAADLERLADGRANWVFTLPESGEPSPWVLDINEIGFDKGRVGLSDAILQADLTVVVDPL